MCHINFLYLLWSPVEQGKKQMELEDEQLFIITIQQNIHKSNREHPIRNTRKGEITNVFNNLAYQNY